MFYLIGCPFAFLSCIIYTAVCVKKVDVEDVIGSFVVGAFSWLAVAVFVIIFIGHLFCKYYPEDGITLWKSKDYKPKDYSSYTGPSFDDGYDHGYE